MMLGSQPKAASETRIIIADLASAMNAGDALSSATVTCSLWSGVDASPSSVISGSATVSGTKVTQKVTGGVEGNIYILTFSGVTAATATVKATMYLAIVTQPV